MWLPVLLFNEFTKMSKEQFPKNCLIKLGDSKYQKIDHQIITFGFHTIYHSLKISVGDFETMVCFGTQMITWWSVFKYLVSPKLFNTL